MALGPTVLGDSVSAGSNSQKDRRRNTNMVLLNL